MATDDKLVRAGTLQKMFARFAQLSGNPHAARPKRDATTGKYDNDAIAEWMDLQADGLAYGVRYALYDYSPVPEGVKVGANAGLVIEPSTETYAGRNDYVERKLFLCPRVNGGVNTDGTAYVTAVEGWDADFDATENTYALTSVYYKLVTDDGEHVTKMLSDTQLEGYEPCQGAFHKDGTLRPFILRACYMDSGNTFSSKSGTQPSGSVGYQTNSAHCGQSDLAWSKESDGLTYWCYGDLEWQMDFMQVMLGTKAPKSVVVGCTTHDHSYTVAVAEEGATRVVLTDAQAATIPVGSTVSVGTSGRAATDVIKCAKVLSKESLGNGTTAVNLDCDATDILANHKCVTMPWKNGTCDGVLGTFGARTTDALTNGVEPFRFQSCEWGHGIWTTLANLYSVTDTEEASGVTHTFYHASDVDAVTTMNEEGGWESVATIWSSYASSSASYIRDLREATPLPDSVAGSSTTGMCVAWYPGARSAQHRETLAGGALSGGAFAGVGCLSSLNTLGDAYWHFGGRSSAIGRSGVNSL